MCQCHAHAGGVVDASANHHNTHLIGQDSGPAGPTCGGADPPCVCIQIAVSQDELASHQATGYRHRIQCQIFSMFTVITLHVWQSHHQSPPYVAGPMTARHAISVALI
jgi:hypothetical protein